MTFIHQRRPHHQPDQLDMFSHVASFGLGYHHPHAHPRHTFGFEHHHHHQANGPHAFGFGHHGRRHHHHHRHHNDHAQGHHDFGHLHRGRGCGFDPHEAGDDQILIVMATRDLDHRRHGHHGRHHGHCHRVPHDQNLDFGGQHHGHGGGCH
ncbi:uncharacterized histidine-rich protein DDB_G0274557-like [Impatiens glandulifera]|uniref:uncharacterized histidine-rich protein DDB_G0274557-like n=1 Tax=Impatiens glandulifera TaxID=253017 RepID=UPI001FB073C2|nr:uncharacterized histidine-rich protein DDB_G0274557-like [Impatiens glandulifera]